MKMLLILMTVLALGASDPSADAGDGFNLPDLSDLDRDSLQALCENLYRRVYELERVLAAQAGENEPSKSELEARVVHLEQALRILRERNARMKLKLELASAAAPARQQPSSPQMPPSDASPPTQAATVAAPSWRYEYKLYLIHESGEGRIEIEYDSGREEEARIDYEIYRKDAITFQCFFRNDAATTYKYQFEIRVAEVGAGNLFAGGGSPNVVGQTVYTTPYLAPGEIHTFEVPIRVTDTSDVDIAAIGNVTPISLSTAGGG